jgi:hypothetical protein
MRIVQLVIGWCLLSVSVQAQLPPVFDAAQGKEVTASPMVRKYLSPVRVVWKSEPAGEHIVNEQRLLRTGTGQADLVGGDLCKLKSDDKVQAAILLDFGK